jgi:hypothetical protein
MDRMMRDREGVMRLAGPRVRSRLGWVIGLGTFLILGILLALGIGCGRTNSGAILGSDFNGGFRWAADDTVRLLRNAQYFKLMGQPELGIKELEEAHRLDPANLKVADALAHCYDELGLGARAQQVYLEALAQAPDNPALQNNLCFSFYQAGDLSQAEACYRKTLDRQPHNQAARNNLGLVLCRQGRQEEARRLWQETAGEAVAAEKLAVTLAALRMTGGVPHARQTSPQTQEKASLTQSPPEPHAPQPVMASPGPPADSGSGPAVAHKVVTPSRVDPGPPAVAPDKVAAPLPAPKRAKLQLSPAPPVSEAAETGPVVENHPGKPQPPRSATTAAPSPPAPVRLAATPATSGKAQHHPVHPGQPPNQEAAGKTPLAKARRNSPGHLTAGELLETNIAILNGNGIQDLARETRSRLSLEGFRVVAINNFRDFGVERTIIYYRPDSARVAAILHKQFFPDADLEASPQLADSINVKVVLGHDLRPQHRAEAPTGHKPRL